MPNLIQTLRDTYASNPAAALNMLPELFQVEEEGLIIEMPCKVGDTVYRKGRFSDTIVEVPITEIKLNRFGITFKAENESNGFCFNDDDFGKTVFLTREEAEKALKERESNA